MNLDEFYNYKNQLIEDIVTDTEIVKLVNPNVDIEHATSLIYTQIFPFEYLPETADEGKTFICSDVDITKVLDSTYYVPSLYVWVFTHKSAMRLEEGGVRVDEICSKICSKVNGSRLYGSTPLEIFSSKRFAPITDYQGKLITFTTSDFNRQHNPYKIIPSKRKP